MTTPTKDEVLAAKAHEQALWEQRREAQEAIRKAAGAELCAAEEKLASEWSKAYALSNALAAYYRSNGGEL